MYFIFISAETDMCIYAAPPLVCSHHYFDYKHVTSSFSFSNSTPHIQHSLTLGYMRMRMNLRRNIYRYSECGQLDPSHVRDILVFSLVWIEGIHTVSQLG